MVFPTMTAPAARSRRLGLQLAIIGALAATFAATPAEGHARAAVTQLELDGRGDNPLGVDDITPTFGWRIEGARDGWSQSAYQIRAARTASEPRPRQAIWDTGQVHSSPQTDIRYAGRALRVARAVVWQVRVWDADGGASDWSARRRGRWACSSRATGAPPAGSSTRAAPRTSRCRSSPASSPSTTAGTSVAGPALPVRCRPAPADAQRPASSPTRSSPPATRTTSSPASTAPTTSPTSCARGDNTLGVAARQRPGLRPPQRHQPGRRPDRRRTRGGRASSRAAASWSPTPRPAPRP